MSEAPSPTLPQHATKRSFHYRDLIAAGARFRPLGDTTIAADYGRTDEASVARHLGLADLSPLPRLGFKGPGMAEWLAKEGITLGADSNRASPCGGGILAARLAPGEVLLLGDLDGNDAPLTALERAWSYDTAGVWPVPRRDASFWFMVTGEASAPMFAKICGVDMRPKSFAGHAIAQTSVARTNCIIIRSDLDGVTAYHLLGDSASAGFMWTSVLDGMAEFHGGPVGLDALLQIAQGRG